MIAQVLVELGLLGKALAAEMALEGLQGVIYPQRQDLLIGLSSGEENDDIEYL